MTLEVENLKNIIAVISGKYVIAELICLCSFWHSD
jgi:hypothetical protein